MHRDKSGYTSPFVGKYLLRNKLALVILWCIDTFFSLFFFRKKKFFTIKQPQRILISNIAQIGDVVITTSLLPVLKAALPDVEIGILVGSWASPLVSTHPHINYVHVLDHWKISRKKTSHYFTERKKVVRELRKIHYDIVLECSYYFPNTAFLSYLAHIPVRIGYTSAGFSPFLTHPVQYTSGLQSAAEHFATLVSLFVPINRDLLHPSLPKGSPVSLPISRYVIVHMGSGNPVKEWDTQKWKELCMLIEKDGHSIVFTGHGEKEQETVTFVKKGLMNAHDTTNRLSLLECIDVVQNATLLIGVDTSIAHIAAATNTPSLLLFCGINPIEHWKPLSKHATVIINKEACYPCFRMHGCMSMDCIQKITPQYVLLKIRAHFSSCVDKKALVRSK